jgi:hypothetical protein
MKDEGRQLMKDQGPTDQRKQPPERMSSTSTSTRPHIYFHHHQCPSPPPRCHITTTAHGNALTMTGSVGIVPQAHRYVFFFFLTSNLFILYYYSANKEHHEWMNGNINTCPTTVSLCSQGGSQVPTATT